MNRYTMIKKWWPGMIIPAILLPILVLFSCNAGNDKKNPEPAAAENHHEHSEKASGLELNNGKKWKADSATLLNVESLKNIVSGAKKESLGSYIQTATDLQAGLNKMVAECKMKGPDHEALHHWLEPLLGKTKALKEVTSVDNATSILGDIEKQVNLFDQYFELT